MTPLISEDFDAFAEGENLPGWHGTFGSEVAEVRGQARELFVHSQYGNAGAIRLPLKLPEGTHAIWARADFRFLPGGKAPMDGALRIALLHHPLGWLHAEERSQIERQLHSSVDLLLRARLLSEIPAQAVSSPAGGLLGLAAGEGRTHHHAFIATLVIFQHTDFSPITNSGNVR